MEGQKTKRPSRKRDEKNEKVMVSALKELLVTFEANSKPILDALNDVQKGVNNLNKHIEQKFKENEKAVKSFTEKVSGLGKKFKDIGKKLTLFVTTPIIAFGVASFRASEQIKALEAVLGSVLQKFKSSAPINQQVADEIKWIGDVANELGVSMSSVIDPYVKYLAASKDSLATNRKVIKSFVGLGSAMGLSRDTMERVIRALEQMQSKGQITAEELKLQLGDALPGAVGLFARAMGVSTKQFLALMKTGSVTSDLLSKVADQIQIEYAGAIEKGSKSARASLARLMNSIFQLRVAFGDTITKGLELGKIFAAITGQISRLANYIKGLSDTQKKWIARIVALVAIFGVLILILGFLLIAATVLIAPLSLAILGIVALAAGIYILIKIVKALLTSIKILAVALYNFIKGKIISAFVSLKETVMAVFSRIVEFFVDFKDKILEFVLAPIEKVKQIIASVGDFFAKGKSMIVDAAMNINDEGGAKQRSMTQTTSNTINNVGGNKTAELNFNFAGGISAKDKDDIESKVKKVVQEQLVQNYYEIEAI